jgi:hypothetical protein
MRLLNRAIISKPDPDAGHTSDDLDLTEGSRPSSTSIRLPDEISFLQAGSDEKDGQLHSKLERRTPPLQSTLCRPELRC